MKDTLLISAVVQGECCTWFPLPPEKIRSRENGLKSVLKFSTIRQKKNKKETYFLTLF